MATDYASLTENLLRFYDFRSKVVLFVGAGGRQLLEPTAGTKKLIAIDRDIATLTELSTKVASKGMGEAVEVVARKFEDVRLSADVVYFEFCLHEMADPLQALAHAKTLARDIVVYDHSQGSEWIFYAAEEDMVRRSAQAIKRFGLRRRERFYAEQHFSDHTELLARVTPQGTTAIERVQRFTGFENIVIPMRYELDLL